MMNSCILHATRKGFTIELPDEQFPAPYIVNHAAAKRVTAGASGMPGASDSYNKMPGELTVTMTK